jgi:uncharacterized Zn-finger protein
MIWALLISPGKTMSKLSQQACTQHHQVITKDDLPLSCPSEDKRLWDAHPRVYLEIEKTGHVVCPYCDTEYTLE